MLELTRFRGHLISLERGVPRVVRNPAEARLVTEELRRRLHTLTPLDDRIRKGRKVYE